MGHKPVDTFVSYIVPISISPLDLPLSKITLYIQYFTAKKFDISVPLKVADCMFYM